MSDHVLALCTFSCSQSTKAYFQILFFKWEFLSKAIELVGWDTKQRSSVERYRRTLRLWRSHAISWEIPSQAGQTFQESSDNIAELHRSLCSCQTWALCSIKQHKQKAGHNRSVHRPVKLNVRRCARSSLGSVWVLEMGSKAHCILSVAFGFTYLYFSISIISYTFSRQLLWAF